MELQTAQGNHVMTSSYVVPFISCLKAQMSGNTRYNCKLVDALTALVDKRVRETTCSTHGNTSWASIRNFDSPINKTFSEK